MKKRILDRRPRRWVRPNLLLNGYCKGEKFPINQRGVTSWSSGYGADGIWASRCTCTMHSDYLIAVSDASESYKRIMFACYETLKAGKRYTASVLCDVVSVSGTVHFRVSDANFSYFSQQTMAPVTKTGIQVLTVPIIPNADQACVMPEILIGNDEGSSISAHIYAVKLEEGEYQTLGSIDASGNPVLYEEPDYLQTLMKCQRYVWNPDYGNGNSIQAYASSVYINTATNGRVVMQLPVMMAGKPSSAITGQFYLTGQGNVGPSSIPVTMVDDGTMSNQFGVFIITPAEGYSFGLNTAYVLSRRSTDARMIFSCE